MAETEQRGRLAKPGEPSCRMCVREMPDIICDLEPHDETIQHRDLHGRTWDWSKLDVHAGPRVYLTLACTEISIMPEDMQDRRVFTIKVERVGPGSFAVRWQGECLSRDREWVYEHIPSERTDEWKLAHRWGYDEALSVAREMAPKLVCNGRTVQDWMAYVTEMKAKDAAEAPSVVQIEAAKLRLITDKRLGKQTPEWVARVAKGLPSQTEAKA